MTELEKDNARLKKELRDAKMMRGAGIQARKPLKFIATTDSKHNDPVAPNVLEQTFEATRSMSRKGNCWDNAVAESFFKTIKVEWIYSKNYINQEQAQLSIFEWIESCYNHRRRHSAIGYQTIEEPERSGARRSQFQKKTIYLKTQRNLTERSH